MNYEKVYFYYKSNYRVWNCWDKKESLFLQCKEVKKQAYII